MVVFRSDLGPLEACRSAARRHACGARSTTRGSRAAATTRSSRGSGRSVPASSRAGRGRERPRRRADAPRAPRRPASRAISTDARFARGCGAVASCRDTDAMPCPPASRRRPRRRRGHADRALGRRGRPADLRPPASATARRRRSGTRMETLPGGIWTEIFTGRSVGRIAPVLPAAPAPHRRGRAAPRSRSDEVDPDPLLVDDRERGRPPRRRGRPAGDGPAPGLTGSSSSSGAVHSRNFGTESEPPELLDEMRARHGDHPVGDCDLHGGTRGGLPAPLRTLARRERPQDRAPASTSSGARTGISSPARTARRTAPGTSSGTSSTRASRGTTRTRRADLRDAIRTVYRRIDEGVGAAVRGGRAGRDRPRPREPRHRAVRRRATSCSPRCSSGSGIGSGQRRGRAGAHPAAAARFAPCCGGSCPAGRGAGSRPRPARSRAARVAGDAGRGAPQQPLRRHPAEPPRPRAVRLRRAGRGGRRAARGAAARARSRSTIPTPASGSSCAWYTADEVFGPDHHPDVPDLIVVFRTRPRAARGVPLGAGRHRPAPDLQSAHAAERRPHRRVAALGVRAGHRAGPASRAATSSTSRRPSSRCSTSPAPDDLDGRPLLAPAAA